MGMKGQLIKPLTIDIAQFKKRYKTLSGLSVYERANVIATERKRAAWAAYRPLEKAQLFDTVDANAETTILVPHLAKATSKRSTMNGALFAQVMAVKRPTEILAVLHALGLFQFMEEDPVIRQSPDRRVWYCIECGTFKPLAEFAADKHNVHGISFACKRCEREAQQVTWKKAA